MDNIKGMLLTAVFVVVFIYVMKWVSKQYRIPVVSDVIEQV